MTDAAPAAAGHTGQHGETLGVTSIASVTARSPAISPVDIIATELGVISPNVEAMGHGDFQLLAAIGRLARLESHPRRVLIFLVPGSGGRARHPGRSPRRACRPSCASAPTSRGRACCACSGARKSTPPCSSIAVALRAGALVPSTHLTRSFDHSSVPVRDRMTGGIASGNRPLRPFRGARRRRVDTGRDLAARG